MADLSSAAPHCPKCFSVVSEESTRCHKCSFNFIILEQPRAKTPAPTPHASPPAKIEAKPKPTDFVPNLDKEIPFRWSPPTGNTTKQKPRFHLSMPHLSLPRLSWSRIPWSQMFIALTIFTLLSMMGYIALAGWTSSGKTTLVIDAPSIKMSNPQELRIMTQTNPFPSRAPAADNAAQALAGSIFNQLGAMNSALQ